MKVKKIILIKMFNQITSFYHKHKGFSLEKTLCFLYYDVYLNNDELDGELKNKLKNILIDSGYNIKDIEKTEIQTEIDCLTIGFIKYLKKIIKYQEKYNLSEKYYINTLSNFTNLLIDNNFFLRKKELIVHINSLKETEQVYLIGQLSFKYINNISSTNIKINNKIEYVLEKNFRNLFEIFVNKCQDSMVFTFFRCEDFKYNKINKEKIKYINFDKKMLYDYDKEKIFNFFLKSKVNNRIKYYLKRNRNSYKDSCIEKLLVNKSGRISNDFLILLIKYNDFSLEQLYLLNKILKEKNIKKYKLSVKDIFEEIFYQINNKEKEQMIPLLTENKEKKYKKRI